MTVYKPISAADWRFVEENIPCYYQRDDVLLCDILLRFIEGEDIAQDDLEMIKENYGTGMQEVSEALQKLEEKLWHEAYCNSKVMFQTQPTGKI